MDYFIFLNHIPLLKQIPNEIINLEEIEQIKTNLYKTLIINQNISLNW
ncbi:hypothetical protein FEM08_16860 [Flavobacterium gilvum]|nr:hypothetical protein FEM08_16860 [Flavobacterium gilvum]